MLRRLRGVLGATIIWAFFWLPFGVALALLFGRPPEYCLYCPSHWVLRFIAAWMAWGGLTGALFALTLIVMERRRSLMELSVVRTATQGALAALFLPIVITVLDIVQYVGFGDYDWSFVILEFGVALALGAFCAVATLRAAQRGSLTSA